MLSIITLLVITILNYAILVSAAQSAPDPAFQKQVAADTRAFSLLRGNLKRALESTPEQFRASWQRPNWHILIQDAPVEAKR